MHSNPSASRSRTLAGLNTLRYQAVRFYERLSPLLAKHEFLLNSFMPPSIVFQHYRKHSRRFPMTIRFADKANCAAIAEIYNHAVLHTAAIWNDRTVDTDNRLAQYEARQLLGYRCW